MRIRPFPCSTAILLLVLAQGAFFLACSSLKDDTNSGPALTRWMPRPHNPGMVAVLPFVNETDVPDIEVLNRESFYSQFSALNYYDLELNRVDQALHMAEKCSGKPWTALTPKQLGQILHADLLIYGRVKALDKYYLGIYAQIALKVNIRVVHSKTGKTRWEKTMVRRSHEGGLPIGLFGIAPAAIRSGLHLREEATIALVDRLNRDLVAQMPDPEFPRVLPTVIEIQVASFQDRKKAEQTLHQLHAKGLHSWIREVNLKSHVWHRVFLGPFYSPLEAEAVRQRVKRDTEFDPIMIHPE
ncbi:MAG: GNA1162 family protein [Desulfobacteraceae bacterium]